MCIYNEIDSLKPSLSSLKRFQRWIEDFKESKPSLSDFLIEMINSPRTLSPGIDLMAAFFDVIFPRFITVETEFGPVTLRSDREIDLPTAKSLKVSFFSFFLFSLFFFSYCSICWCLFFCFFEKKGSQTD